ncbi:MAG: alcohol dehydrogenase catalytic domain-containing protein [Candidatus Omnitrophica bacterium]|nr:alcohol dehydrogenase catalytic domain-containing protein [Candidatus Omnitrophota bacterium]
MRKKGMLTAKYYSNTDIRLEDIPVPKIMDGEILVKVAASGICGTDVMEWYRIKKAPRVLGHEIAGTIVESRSAKYTPGQKVFVSHHVACNKCKYCLSGNHTACETLHAGNYDPGGYSEFVRVPGINVESGVYILPEHLSFAEATMIEPLACALRGQKVIDVKSGQIIMVLGSGVSGLLNIMVAGLTGAKVIATDIDEYRLKKAKECGADEVLRAEKAGEVRADKIIICTAALSAIGQAFKCIDRKGTILLFAIPDKNIEIPTVDMWRNEITITSSYGAAGDDLAQALEIISSGKLDMGQLITHRLPLRKIQEGFRLVAQAKESLKVVLEI